ncbi:MAG: hypothetical protein F4X74_01180 [Acidimicrobiia bacterium]|nr:hypothetical protein [Acidimicrobiia bacterium]
MAITPSPFMLLEASQGDGPLHFIASVEAGHVQISGRGDRWGTVKTGEGEPRVLPGLHRTPAAAAAVLARHYDLVPYRNAAEFHRWRERDARRAAAQRRWNRRPPRASLHVPLAPSGYTLSTDWSDGMYRFCGTAEAGEVRLEGVGTHWSGSVADAADASNSHIYGAEFVTAEEAAAAVAAAGHQVTLWDRATEQRREHPDMIPLIDEHGDTLWVVDREWYYGLADLATHERLPHARDMGTAGRVL